MTKEQVRIAVMTALNVAQHALTGEARDLPDDVNPFEAIQDFDSLASVEVTTSVCSSLGISSSKNPFLHKSESGITIGMVVDAFWSLSKAKEK